jgi:hypothetical protein
VRAESREVEMDKSEVKSRVVEFREEWMWTQGRIRGVATQHGSVEASIACRQDLESSPEKANLGE